MKRWVIQEATKKPSTLRKKDKPCSNEPYTMKSIPALAIVCLLIVVACVLLVTFVPMSVTKQLLLCVAALYSGCGLVQAIGND